VSHLQGQEIVITLEEEMRSFDLLRRPAAATPKTKILEMAAIIWPIPSLKPCESHFPAHEALGNSWTNWRTGTFLMIKYY
jgi:hypothetical protein